MVPEHQKDLIRNQLDDPDIEIDVINEDSQGPFVTVYVSGSKQKAKRLTTDDFDITRGPRHSEKGLLLELRPKF